MFLDLLVRARRGVAVGHETRNSVQVNPPHVRGAVHALQSYEQGAPDRCEIELADNTNAFGAAPSALRALVDVRAEQVFRYPSPYSIELKEGIADYVGVAPDEVCLGCGSGDVLDCALRAFSEPGDTVALMDPSFFVARVFTLTNGLSPRMVPLAPDLDLDADAMVSPGSRVMYLCSPNNPTGNSLARPALESVLERAPGLVILDEAYAEYASSSMAARAPAHGGLLVLRTFSKAFGLAGLRIGYGVASRQIIRDIEKVRGPYKVNALGERAALAAVREDRAWVRDAVARTTALRDRFAAELRARGFAPLPSAGNFLLVPVPDAPAAAAALRARQIAVRPFRALARVGDALRITIGTGPMMERVVHALSEAR